MTGKSAKNVHAREPLKETNGRRAKELDGFV